MSLDRDFLYALIAMAVASIACRVGGFALMSRVKQTPAVSSAIAAMPLAIMIGLVTPAALSGRPPELIGIVTAGAAMRLTGSDLFAALCGVAAVAVARALFWPAG